MAQFPPLWQIVVFTLQGLLSLALLWIGINFSGSDLRSEDVVSYGAPLIFTLLTDGLAYWLNIAEMRSLASLVVIASLAVLLLVLVVALGIGI